MGVKNDTGNVFCGPLPSSGHHLSYDDWLKDKTGKLSKLFCAALCTTVVYNST